MLGRVGGSAVLFRKGRKGDVCGAIVGLVVGRASAESSTRRCTKGIGRGVGSVGRSESTASVSATEKASTSCRCTEATSLLTAEQAASSVVVGTKGRCAGRRVIVGTEATKGVSSRATTK